MLEFQNVQKSVTLENGEALTILHPMSFAIAKGESVSIVGPSGSGKSTLLSLAAGLDLPTSGKIQAAGLSLESSSDDQRSAYRSKHVGIVFQAFHLFGHLTALENVRIAAVLSQNDLPKDRRASLQDLNSQALSCLEAVKLTHRQNHFPSQLSGGEKQRVAIARALINHPPILLCDEPTGNLDTANAEKVFELLMDLSRREGCTLILVTHDERLARLTGRRITLEAGRVASESKGQNS